MPLTVGLPLTRSPFVGLPAVFVGSERYRRPYTNGVGCWLRADRGIYQTNATTTP